MSTCKCSDVLLQRSKYRQNYVIPR